MFIRVVSGALHRALALSYASLVYCTCLSRSMGSIDVQSARFLSATRKSLGRGRLHGAIFRVHRLSSLCRPLLHPTQGVLECLLDELFRFNLLRVLPDSLGDDLCDLSTEIWETDKDVVCLGSGGVVGSDDSNVDVSGVRDKFFGGTDAVDSFSPEQDALCG